MGRPPRWTVMVDYAIHSADGEKISLVRLKSYIEKNWKYDFKANKRNKEKLKDALTERIEDGLVEQDGQSFRFSRKGERHYEEHYEADNEEEEEEMASRARKKKKT
ncbi:hypothetical protein JCM6882_003927 [Rhodosporidiobolus microsporus]